MKKRNGFTLIELLAVIVILAVIALIATPLVLKYIETSKNNARLRSAENYLDTVEKAVVNHNMSGQQFSPNICVVKNNKLYCDGKLLDVSIKGEKPDNKSIIVFKDSKIDKVKLLYDDKIIVNNEKDILVYSEDIEILPAGLYDSNNEVLATWDELVNKYGLNIEADYNPSSVVIPGSMYAVINNNKNLSEARKVVIDDSVKTIGKGSFSDCLNLESINIPSSVTSIGPNAFYNCTSLESINIPNGVTSIGIDAFANCTSLESINIPNSVTSIGTHVFYNCSNLSEIIVDKDNTKYDSRNNSNAIIETATNKLIAGSNNTIIPNTVTAIDNLAFFGLKFKSIVIPNSVTSIGIKAFANCTSLESINIPNSVTSIGTIAFDNCSNLSEIIVDKDNTKYDSRNNSNAIIETATNKLIVGSNNTIIPNTVTEIINSAFSGLKFKSIVIPNSVTSIATKAFYNCSNLSEIIVDKDNTKYDSRNNSNAIIETATNKLIAGSNNTIIPNTVTAIDSAAFSGLKFKSIVIPNSVTSIGTMAFANCTSLESITIPNSVTKINFWAFLGNGKLKTIYYKGTATGAPWGAPNATVISDY